jgi:hypothetical protein
LAAKKTNRKEQVLTKSEKGMKTINVVGKQGNPNERILLNTYAWRKNETVESRVARWYIFMPIFGIFWKTWG